MFLSESAFNAKYRPQQNHLIDEDDDAPFNGCMFETYGAELAYVQSINAVSPGRVWTILDMDNGLVCTSGFHVVNRQGYIVTEVPFEGDHADVVEDDHDVRLLSDAEICQRFEIACYQVKELPFPHSDKDGDRFVICTPEKGFELPGHLPDYATQADAEAAAVKVFDLRKRLILQNLEHRLEIFLAEITDRIEHDELTEEVLAALERLGADRPSLDAAAAVNDRKALLQLLEKTKIDYATRMSC